MECPTIIILSDNSQKYVDWNDRTYRLLMLDDYIKKNKYLDGITKNKIGNRIWYYFSKANENIYDSAIELGYSINDVTKKKPKGYYDNFEKLAQDIELLIETKYKRFPLVEEIKRELRISSRVIRKHGNIDEIKRKMGYLNSELVDLSGHVNKSVWELITANFLYLNNVEFKRNQLLFEDKKYTYRSDFYFDLPNGDYIHHVELWGHSKDKKNKGWKVRDHYLEQRIAKERVYKEYSIPYKSLEGYEVFHNKSYNSIQDSLISFFSFLKIPLNKVDYSMLVPANDIKIEDILKKVMHLSEDFNTLPSTGVVQSNDIQTYLLVKKHFGTWVNFSKIVQKDIMRLDNYWTLEIMMGLMEELFEEFGYIPSSDYMKKHIEENQLFIKVLRGLYRFPEFINIKLAFYKSMVEQKRVIPHQEIIWLLQIAHSVGNIAPHIKGKQKKEACHLISKIDSKLIEEAINKEENEKDIAFEKEIFALFDYFRNWYGSILISYGKYRKLKKENPFLMNKNYYHRRRALGRLHEWRIKYLKREIKGNRTILDEEKIYLRKISEGITNNQFKPTDKDIHLATWTLNLLNS